MYPQESSSSPEWLSPFNRSSFQPLLFATSFFWSLPVACDQFPLWMTPGLPRPVGVAGEHREEMGQARYQWGRSSSTASCNILCSLDSLPPTPTNSLTVRRDHVWDIRRTSCCSGGDFRAMPRGFQVPCDCAFMWHFNYCCRFLLITLFSPTALMSYTSDTLSAAQMRADAFFSALWTIVIVFSSVHAFEAWLHILMQIPSLFVLMTD